MWFKGLSNQYTYIPYRKQAHFTFSGFDTTGSGWQACHVFSTDSYSETVHMWFRFWSLQILAFRICSTRVRYTHTNSGNHSSISQHAESLLQEIQESMFFWHGCLCFFVIQYYSICHYLPLLTARPATQDRVPHISAACTWDVVGITLIVWDNCSRPKFWVRGV